MSLCLNRKPGQRVRISHPDGPIWIEMGMNGRFRIDAPATVTIDREERIQKWAEPTPRINNNDRKKPQ